MFYLTIVLAILHSFLHLATPMLNHEAMREFLPLAGETARILPRPHLTTHCRSPRPVLLSIACVDPLPLQVAAADTACNCLHCRPCHVWLLTASPASDRAPKSLPWQAGARECATKHSSEPAV